MTETLMKKVLRFRAMIYIAFLLAIIAIEINHYVHASESSIESHQIFWPPDMVPHPEPPRPEPKDDNNANRYRNEKIITIISNYK